MQFEKGELLFEETDVVGCKGDRRLKLLLLVHKFREERPDKVALLFVIVEPLERYFFLLLALLDALFIRIDLLPELLQRMFLFLDILFAAVHGGNGEGGQNYKQQQASHDTSIENGELVFTSSLSAARRREPGARADQRGR